MESPQQPRQAPPVGRALRILLGLALMVYVAPVYFQVPVQLSVRVLLLMLGLVGVYSFIQIVISRSIFAFDPCLGAVVAAAFLVALYVGGATGLPIIGHGVGELAAVTFLERLAVGCWGAGYSRLRSDGDPQSFVWKAHRVGVSHLFPARQA